MDVCVPPCNYKTETSSWRASSLKKEPSLAFVYNGLTTNPLVDSLQALTSLLNTSFCLITALWSQKFCSLWVFSAFEQCNLVSALTASLWKLDFPWWWNCWHLFCLEQRGIFFLLLNLISLQNPFSLPLLGSRAINLIKFSFRPDVWIEVTALCALNCFALIQTKLFNFIVAIQFALNTDALDIKHYNKYTQTNFKK